LNDADAKDALISRLDTVAAEVEKLREAMARNFANGEIATFRFGPAGKPLAEVTDDRGMAVALSYAVWNESTYPIEVGFAGGWLRVGRETVAVFPITVNGHVQLRLSPEVVKELEEGDGQVSVVRWRFSTPQPFYIGSIR